MPSVLIVEDDPGISGALLSYLKRNDCTVHVAATGRDALSLMPRSEFVILDLGLPDMDGFEVLRRLRVQHPSLPVMLLSARTDDMDKIVALELGADDYLTKPFNPRELLARMRAILRRAGRSAPEAAAHHLAAGGVVMDLVAHTVTANGSPVNLTPREFEFLQTLMRQPGRAFRRDDLLTAIWGQDYVGDPKTVDVVIGRLRDKIEADPTAPVRILTVRGVGYKFAADNHA